MQGRRELLLHGVRLGKRLCLMQCFQQVHLLCGALAVRCSHALYLSMSCLLHVSAGVFNMMLRPPSHAGSHMRWRLSVCKVLKQGSLHHCAHLVSVWAH